jgi:prolipoprotein diacylglyceryl transferase
MSLATPSDRYFLGTLPWYSVLIVGAIFLSVLLSMYEEKKRGLPKDTVIDSAFYLIPLGIIGARLYYVLFEWPQFASSPLSIFKIWEGGLAIYGALIGGFIGLFLFAKRKKLAFPMLLDLYSPCVVLSQAIGRWGNYFNQEAYGYAAINPTHQFFPLAVFITHEAPPAWHYATFFYESVWDLAIFLILLILRRKPLREGNLFLIYIMLYALGRAVIEGMRTDSLMAFGGTIRVSQILSILLASGIGIYLLLQARRRKTHA